ncbi:hypothetical protein JCM21714_4505 [Gracilibacillus boraciitolerans JCM 21714]|uniref:Uncharacterized protein n=1 Tax=Gracilibacillus boraciitolerans JCM 21714 TaxID=1298598 RepID=W4VPH8_9BACI|nr:hypothetical protein [Gracilibacillus boraciitolerans]GAE95285.1 hypothetical protein JCM21714_4505 [Gracilibacillus boraciitolerans JCM 21714]
MKKILWSGLAFVIISWIGNYLYFESKQIQQPIFLTHYYEEIYYEDLQLTFFYLTNKKDPVDVQYVEIDGMEIYPMSNQGFTIWHENVPQVQYEQAFRHQYLKSVTIQFPFTEMAFINEQKQAWSFSSMDVYFNDQTMVTTDIGEVVIQPSIQGNDILQTQSSGGSSNGQSFTTMTAEQALTITDITLPFENVADEIEMKLDNHPVKITPQDRKNATEIVDPLQENWQGTSRDRVNKDLFPLDLAENDSVRLTTRINPERRSYFEFGIYLNGITVDGKPFKSAALIIDRPYLKQGDINEIIEERQESP